jgi:hypothetical protein
MSLKRVHGATAAACGGLPGAGARVTLWSMEQCPFMGLGSLRKLVYGRRRSGDDYGCSLVTGSECVGSCEEDRPGGLSYGLYAIVKDLTRRTADSENEPRTQITALL